MSGSTPVVKTNSGSVKGILKETDVGKKYFSFQHIPYVEQPKGDLRFKDPKPVKPWNDILDCTKEGSPAYCLDFFLPNGPKVVGSDDCLGVNVFTPDLKPAKPLPVFVWIHGGGFVCGSSSTLFYGPDYIIEKDVILVSFNYRLNIFGFLSLKDPKVGVPGNAGLKDQTMALKWIKENISCFGGDSNNITIVGLFNKAIAMSGSAFNPWATAPHTYPECLKRMGIALGLPEDADEEAFLSAISKEDPMKLMILDTTSIKPEEKLDGGIVMSAFLPQVEPYVSEMCFLPKSPLELGRDAWSKDIDVIFGGCSNEGAFFYNFSPDENGLAEINKNNFNLLPRDLQRKSDIEKENSKGSILKKLYFNEKPISRDTLNEYTDYLDECAFWHGIHRAILQRQMSDGKGKTFLYRLNIDPSVDNPDFYKFVRTLTNTPHMKLTIHGEDLALLFRINVTRRFIKGDDNYEAQQVFLNTFVQFIKRGNPSCQISTNTKITWNPLPKEASDDVPALEICRDTFEMQQLQNYEKIKVWNEFGPVKGISKETELGKKYFSFQHIPYAQKPEGELRFRDPKPVKAWNEVLDCTKEGSPAYSYDHFLPEGTRYAGGDDCLGLNIFTPDLQPSKQLPVFVWIHGGAFVVGSSSVEFYGPEFIVEKDVIMVSMNYRLGIFGFMSLKDPNLGVPGNAGLKDQTMALKWIKENISFFGGDPNNITLSGESAGAASVHYHMISPLSEGLFNKAIPISGSSLCPWAFAPEKYPFYLNKLAVELGLDQNADDESILRALNKTDPKKLLDIDYNLVPSKEKIFGSVLMSAFVPQIEPYVSEMCFLPKSPLELGREAWSKDIDIIIGGTSNEGQFFYIFSPDETQIPEINKNYGLLLPVDLRQNLTPAQAHDKGNYLKRLYYGDEEISVKNLSKYMDYLDERHFWHGIYRAVMQRLVSNGNGKTYLFYLNVPPSSDVPEYYKFLRNLGNLAVESDMSGTCHGDDLVLLFSMSFCKRFPPGSDNYEAQQKYLNSFKQFVKHGNPNCDLLKPANWTPLSNKIEEIPKCMRMGRDEWFMQDLPNYNKIKIWNDLYEADKLI
uniref:carboxylesterase n=1 Tax=Culicoides sonorensis TaxID=179676 RepID=A0A336M3D7_CULSO